MIRPSCLTSNPGVSVRGECAVQQLTQTLVIRLTPNIDARDRSSIASSNELFEIRYEPDRLSR